jgi:hypothetical protein
VTGEKGKVRQNGQCHLDAEAMVEVRTLSDFGILDNSRQLELRHIEE